MSSTAPTSWTQDTPFGPYLFEVGACSNVDDRHVRAIVWSTPLDRAWASRNEYRTVRNIDGSDRFMKQDSYWSFMPYEFDEAARAARSFVKDCRALAA